MHQVGMVRGAEETAQGLERRGDFALSADQ